MNFGAILTGCSRFQVDCGHQLPIDTANMQTMYDAIADGLIIPKLINAVINDEKLHIDRRALNKKKKLV
jgi:hypothetical protein